MTKEYEMRFRILDIETVPDYTMWTRGEPKWRWTMAGSSASEVPYNEAVHTCGEAVPSLVQEEPFPPPQANRVVAISFADVVLDVEKSPRYRLDAVRGWCSWGTDGKVATSDVCEVIGLRWFDEWMTKSAASAETPTLVTWNGRCFDLPVLSMRSMRHGISFGWYYKDRNVRYRYSDEGHLDLMDCLGDYGAARSMRLDDVCHLVGLPGKLDVCGARVADVVGGTRERPDTGPAEMETIKRYCTQDVLQTALVFLRSRYHVGKISAEEHDACAATFRDHPEVAEILPEICWDRFMLGVRR